MCVSLNRFHNRGDLLGGFTGAFGEALNFLCNDGKAAPGFTGKRVIKENGDKGDANDAVIAALIAANALVARGRLKHQYPHSWRSKKPGVPATKTLKPLRSGNCWPRMVGMRPCSTPALCSRVSVGR